MTRSSYSFLYLVRIVKTKFLDVSLPGKMSDSNAKAPVSLQIGASIANGSHATSLGQPNEEEIGENPAASSLTRLRDDRLAGS